MAAIKSVTGVREILSKLSKADKMLGKRLERGLKKAGKFLLRETTAIVPVQFGDLKGSAFTRNVGGSGFRADIIVGYSGETGYAIYVHENLEAAHGKEFNILHAEEIATATTPAQKRVWFSRGETQQAKFLEQPAREKRREILHIIYHEI